MSGHLILIRHAQSLTNVSAVLDSRPPGSDLSALGREQVVALADRLAGRRIVSVYSSTTTRARLTAEGVAERHGVTVEHNDELLEIDCGDLDGLANSQSWEVLKGTFATWNTGDRTVRMPAGESWDEVARRMARAVSQIAAGTHRGDVVLVSHGGALRILLETLLGGEEANRVGYPRNCGLVVLSGCPTGHWKVEEHDVGTASPFAVLGTGQA